MIEQIQKFLAEYTGGIIHSRSEAIYVLIIMILVVVLIGSLLFRSIAA